jgi:hypothetical protein
MIAELGNDDMGQQARSCQATLDGARRRRRFNHAVTAAAGELRPHVPDDLEALGNVLELFRYVFAELTQLAAAVRATVAVWSVRDDFAREMFRQRLAFGTGLRARLLPSENSQGNDRKQAQSGNEQ